MINNKIKDILTFSWDLYSKNALQVTSLCLFVMMVSMVCNLIGSNAINPMSIQSLIFNLSSRLFNIGLSLGLLHFILLLNNGVTSDIKTLFSSFDLIFRYFNASILMGLLTFLVLIPSLIIFSMSCELSNLLFMLVNSLELTPDNMNFNFSVLDTSDVVIHNNFLFIFGVIITIINIVWILVRFQFFQYIIVDKKCGAIESLKLSYAITDNKLSVLLQFALIIVGINFLGLLLFGIGLFITIPFSMIAMTQLYLRLNKNSF